MVSKVHIICSCLAVALQLEYVRCYKPFMLNMSDIVTYTYPANYTGTTPPDSIADFPDITACGNLTFFEEGTMRREEDLIHCTKYHSGSVIVLHGLDGTGESMKEAFMTLKPDLVFEHVKFVFPTAPLIRYTTGDIDARRAWFDYTDTFKEAPEKEPSLQRLVEDVKEVIRIERDLGIPLHRIIVGGFSMGAAMAMYIGYKALPILNGIFAISQWHHSNVSLYEKEDKKKRFTKTLPPLFYAYGEKDRYVLNNWNKTTLKKFCTYGFDKKYDKEIDSQAKIRREELDALLKWIGERLPQLDNPSDLYDEEYPAPSPTTPSWIEIGQKITTKKKYTTNLDQQLW